MTEQEDTSRLSHPTQRFKNPIFTRHEMNRRKPTPEHNTLVLKSNPLNPQQKPSHGFAIYQL